MTFIKLEIIISFTDIADNSDNDDDNDDTILSIRLSLYSIYFFLRIIEENFERKLFIIFFCIFSFLKREVDVDNDNDD